MRVWIITNIHIYFGSPSPVLANSCVLIDQHPPRGGQPTVWGYNSGITSSTQSINVDADVRIIAANSTPNTTIWTFHNTTEGSSGVAVDVHIAGWLITGPLTGTWLEQTLDGVIS